MSWARRIPAVPAALAALSIAGASLAQTSYAPPAPQESRPERVPEPARAKSAYLHDGFFARVEVGAGIFSASSGPSDDDGQREFSGATFSWGISAGGSVADGIVIGGAALNDRVLGLEGTDASGGDIDLERVRFSLVLIGLLVDVYPMPKHGFHLQGVAGAADLNVSRQRSTTAGQGDIDDPDGLAFAFGTGYELWVHPEISVGIMARLIYAPMTVRETGTGSASVDVLAPALLLSGTTN